jgi:hypothetical protein
MSVSEQRRRRHYFILPGTLLTVLNVERVGGTNGGNLNELLRRVLVGEEGGHQEGRLQTRQVLSFREALWFKINISS